MSQVILQLGEEDIFSSSQVKTVKERYSSFLSDVSQDILLHGSSYPELKGTVA
jgi:hypothetical protein